MDIHRKEKKHKEKRRSNEKRKERSRDAARSRRSRETDIFTELAAALPVKPEQAMHLDKASVMRLAIAYLKVRAVVNSIPASMAKSESSTEMDELFPKALNGFMLVLSSDGNMVYLSENVSDYLGVSQMDMMGQSVYEYSHPCDHDELRECLSSKPSEKSEKRACSFFLRLKCTLTSKGRKVNLKSASYKVIHCTGKLTNIRDSNSNCVEVDNEERGKEDESAEIDNTNISLVLVGSPIPHPSNIEIPLGRHTFLSKHSLSMKFTYADEKLAEYLGWNSEELMGRSVFEFYHALDNFALDKCFKCLFSKGQCETVAYRFLGKKGGYAWVITQATLIHCSKQQKPISVVCVNYILSGIEHEDEVYSERQLAGRDSADLVKSEASLPALVPTASGPPAPTGDEDDDKKEEEAVPADVVNVPEEPAIVDDDALRKSDRDRPRPLTVTASIFQRSLNWDDCGKDESRKVDGFLRSFQNEKASVGVRTLKESPKQPILNATTKWLQDSKSAAAERQEDCRPTFASTPFIFQGKPAIERDSSDSPGRRGRPQAVTRHLFAPLAQQSQQEQQQQQLSCRPSPQTATASIFAPRTEDMNKGFLTFSEDQPGLTMLKDEPEDLTHLAPTPGDVCVPLEDPPFLSDMLDDILGSDNYCQLLSPSGVLAPELRSTTDLGESLKDADLVDITRTKADRLADSDPFMYGDSPESPCGIDPSVVSPSLSKYRQSPERSVDSLGSPTGGSGGDGLSEDEMLMLGISDSIADDELALRAPYIPMSDQDETLELLISDDMVMWGSSQPSDKGSSKWLAEDREQRGSESSLAQLLRTEQVASRRYNDYGGGLVNPAQIFGQMPKKNTTFESGRWSTGQERTDRPSKRIHTPCADSESEHKRLKCESSPFERRDVVLAVRPDDDISLTRQQQQQLQRLSTTTIRRKQTLGGVCGSQLLRCLVSHTPGITSPRTYDDLGGASSSSSSLSSSPSSEAGGLNRDTPERVRALDGIIDSLAESEGDRGGGGGGGGRRGDSQGGRDGDHHHHRGLNGLDNIDANRRNPSCGIGSSVLMNLLVSGCDDALMDSRNVPTCLLPRNLTSPLSVNVDNQTVPQCVDVNSVVSLDHFSPDTRRQLSGPFTGGGGSSMASPPTCAMSFDSLDYDVGGSATCLLQVGPDLLGGLLDRNVV
ncbi:PREDICTED: protein similar isoform X2 [Dinoponera quadriceps]|uniref:Protein similar isoform X2 n=1 Tax=Dinoponera quadriceps TaxID=609295 RepID=A0A6P3XGY8_DINQU|nr:PREDICTED: protein similar isoform X2 [Dinoponera quadriceps]